MTDFDAFVRRLYGTSDFVDVGQAVCAAAKPVFALHQIVVMLNAPDGRPLICVDNMPPEHDDMRMAYVDHIWRVDPFLAELRTSHFFATQPPDHEWMKFSHDNGYHGDDVFTVTLPITSVPRVIGIVRCGSLVEYTAAHLRELAAMSTQVSVRLAQLGVTPRAAPGTGDLTSRQFDCVRLAEHGQTNVEIAGQLEISQNTVKKHLQEAFEKLGVSNRTELAALLARAGQRDRVATGITRLDGCTVTRGRD